MPTRFVPTRIEKKVIELVRDAGARDVRVAEHGFDDANIEAEWNGTSVILKAYPTSRADIYERRRRVLGEAIVEGVAVVEAEQFGRRQVVVECGAFAYEARKYPDIPWDVDLMTSFVVAVAHSAGC